MSAGLPREKLIKQINHYLGPKKIGHTARCLAKISSRADILSMLHKLDLLSIVTHRSVQWYRRELKVPKLHLQLITQAFRTALYGGKKPKPLVFQIYSGDHEAVEVKTTDRQIEVTLIRVDPPRFRRARPRR